MKYLNRMMKNQIVVHYPDYPDSHKRYKMKNLHISLSDIRYIVCCIYHHLNFQKEQHYHNSIHHHLKVPQYNYLGMPLYNEAMIAKYMYLVIEDLQQMKSIRNNLKKVLAETAGTQG